MADPLQGVRVLELGQFIAGPFAGLMLADMGAEVIKIERPGTGDPFRHFGTGGADGGFTGFSHNFTAFNRNKSSLTLDIAHPDGRALFCDLAARADVIVENFRPDVLPRLGLGWEALRELNPKLVFCSISGFSADGPYKDRPAYDAIGQAYSGMLGTLLDECHPRMRGPTITDQISGMQAAYGVLGALLRRAQTGIGGRVEVSMLDASMYHMPDSFTALTQSGFVMDSQTRAAFSLSFAFVCSDRTVLAIQVSSTEKFWRNLLAAVERADLAQDPRFVNRSGRVQNFPDLIEALQPVFAARTRDAWQRRLADADVPCAPVLSIPEAMQDPEVKHAGLFHTIPHARGALTTMHRAVRLDGRREDSARPPPELGEHTDACLSAFGISEERTAALRKSKVI